MDLSKQRIEFREVNCRNTNWLEFRLIPTNVSVFKWIYIKCLQNWSSFYVFVDNPNNYEAGEEELAYTLARSGQDGVPTLEWLQENIKTYEEFENLRKEINSKYINE